MQSLQPFKKHECLFFEVEALQFDFDFFSLQPLDGKKLKENTQKTIEYCSKHPLWRLSLQTHKFLGIP